MAGAALASAEQENALFAAANCCGWMLKRLMGVGIWCPGRLTHGVADLGGQTALFGLRGERSRLYR